MKLRRLKIRLRDWNKDVFRNIFDEIQQATNELDDIQKEIAQYGNSDTRFDQEMDLVTKVISLLEMRRTFHAQKSHLH